MTRRFLGAPVPPGILDGVLSSALRAPSAGFTQGVDLLVLTDADRRRRFWELSSAPDWRETPGAGALLAAPVIVVPLTDPSSYSSRYAEPDKAGTRLGGIPAGDWEVPYPIVDAAFATMLVLLAAEDAGLGALFFQLHGDKETVLEGLGVPTGHDTIGAVALGYRAGAQPTSSPRPRRRRAAEVIHHEHW